MPISKIKSSGIEADSVTGSNIVDGTVATADLVNGAVTSAKLDTNIAVAGTLDVTGATTLSDTLSVPLANSNDPSIRLESPTTDVDFAISSYNDANGTYVSLGANHYLNSGGNDAVFDTNKKSAGILLDARNNGRIQFLTANTGIAASRMEISKEGYVTKPNQPAFCIFGDTNPNFVTDGSDTTIFIGHSGSGAAAFDHNIGSHWSYTTGRFTAPVAGRYIFSFTVTTGDTNSHFVDIHKNGARVGGHALSYAVGYITATKTVILDLAANDYVDARRRASGYSFYSCNFAGYLLG